VDEPACPVLKALCVAAAVSLLYRQGSEKVVGFFLMKLEKAVCEQAFSG
jgi:hypothetical protein